MDNLDYLCTTAVAKGNIIDISSSAAIASLNGTVLMSLEAHQAIASRYPDCLELALYGLCVAFTCSVYSDTLGEDCLFEATPHGLMLKGLVHAGEDGAPTILFLIPEQWR